MQYSTNDHMAYFSGAQVYFSAISTVCVLKYALGREPTTLSRENDYKGGNSKYNEFDLLSFNHI